jgi:hypothetical protein
MVQVAEWLPSKCEALSNWQKKNTSKELCIVFIIMVKIKVNIVFPNLFRFFSTFCFVLFFWDMVWSMWSRLTWKLIFDSGWPQICGPSASASKVQGLQMCSTMPS